MVLHPLLLLRTVDCGAPQPPANGSIDPYSSTLEGAVISFQCDQGFSPSEEVTATCVRDGNTGSGTWSPDPAGHICTGTCMYMNICQTVWNV